MSLYLHAQHLFGIRVVNANCGQRVGGANISLLDREDGSGRRNVAANDLVANRRLFNADLGKGVIDINVGPGRRSDDGAFTGQQISAAEAIDLTLVGGCRTTSAATGFWSPNLQEFVSR